MDVPIVTTPPETDMPCLFMSRPSMLLATLSIVQYVAVFAPQEKRWGSMYLEITTHDVSNTFWNNGFSGYESLDMVIHSKILTISQNEYRCIECGHVCKTKQNISGHIEANHVENHPGVICKICTKICTTRDALRKHMVRYHAQNPTYR